MSSSISKRRASLRRTGQRLTAVLAATALTAGSAVALAPAALADYPTVTAASEEEEVEVDILVRPYLTRGITYTAGDTITANPGIWEKGATLTYRWLRGNEYIEGANGLTLKLGSADTWSTFQFEVTAELAGRITVTEYTMRTAEVQPAPVENFTGPSLSGDLIPGALITLDPGTWTPGSTFKVQWMLNGKPTWGGNTREFLLTDDHLGGTISASVTASENWHTPVTALTSPTGPVVKADVEITGNPVPGEVLTAAPGPWSKGRKLSYEWFVDGASTGYTTPAYGLSDEDGGHDISVKVRSTSLITAYSKPVSVQPSVQNFQQPDITGEPVEGQILTAVPGRWSEGTELAYQWMREGEPIPGAVNSTYRLTREDAGSRLTVDVTGTRQGYVPLTRGSWRTGTVTTNYVDILERATMKGEPYLGYTLTASPGIWSEGAELQYQWYRNSSTPIPGATSSTYKITAADIGTSLSVKVTGSLPFHKSSVSHSNGTKIITTATVPNYKAPTITGTPAVGTFLQADPGSWAPGAKLSYQWYRDGRAILYAETDRIFISSPDIGTKLSVRVTAVLPDHRDGSVYSAPTEPVPAPAVMNTKAPALTGSAVRGQTLTVDPGTWTDKATLTYEWLRNGTAIPGAGGPSYTLGAQDVNTRISVNVTGYLSQYKNLTVATPASAVVANPQMAAVIPAISGTPLRGSVLAATGTWPAGTALTYQWLRNGTPVSGAGNATYTLTGADTGARISVKVTGSLDGYLPASATSAETAAVTVPVVSAPASVGITGNLFQGQRLTAVPGTWSQGAVLAYQWNAGGKTIAGATAQSLVLGPDQTGKTITVTVTGTLPEAAPAVVTSAPTAAIGKYTVTNTAKPVITGTPVTGQTLKASPGTWTPGTVLTYQWKNSGVITGATGATYTLTDADAGKTLTVTVTGTLPDYNQASATSDATAAVTRPPVLNTVKPSITGSPAVGQTLKASPGSWTPGTAPSYQWKRGGTSITGAVTAEYKLTAADFGTAVSVTVTGSLAGYAPTTATSPETAKVIRNTVVNTARPVIAGASVIGQTLTVSPGTWTPGTVLTYQWYNTGIIAGATGSTYTLADADEGKAVSVKVTGTLPDYNSASVMTDATTAVSRPWVINTVKPAVTGTPAVGQILKASPGTWTKGAALSYQWKRAGISITGAAGAEYKLTAADKGKTISVAVTGTLTGSNPGTAVSPETAAVIQYTVANTVKPAVTGTAVVGQTLKASPGTWTPGTVLTYQWKNSGVITGATGASYTLTAADLGKTLTVTVTGTLPDYAPASTTSAATAKVVQPTVANTAPPTVTGSTVQGQTLTAVPGTWTKGTALKFQWNSGGKAVPGATAATYRLGAADFGKTMTVTVTGTLAGYEQLAATSKATAAVTRLSVANTAAPAITGSTVAGSVLKVSSGTWTKGTVLTYQWMLNGAAAPGATGSSYTVPASAAGKTVTVAVTGSLADYTPLTVTVRAAAAVSLPKVTVSGTPAVSGTAAAGNTLKVSSAGTWTAGTSLTYQWLRNGAPISGATAASYKLAAADKGKTVSVKVTGTKAGYQSVSAESKKTAAVR